VSVATSETLSKRVVNLYVEGQYSARRVAEVVGIDRQRVSRILREQGITLAPRGAGRRRPLKVNGPLSEGTLRQLYVDRRLSSVDIGRGLGVSDRLVRSRLKLWGIETRSRGQWNSFDRSDIDPEELWPLYVEKEWPASTVGQELGVSGRIVLRSAHVNGLAVRAGGTYRSSEAFDIVLIEALYDDPIVSKVLASYGVAIVREPGPLWERFPRPVELTRELLDDLYNKCGVSSFHIELLSGTPVPTVLHKLEEYGIERRGRGGRCPFIRRWHERQRRSVSGSTRLSS
jgi:transposase